MPSPLVHTQQTSDGETRSRSYRAAKAQKYDLQLAKIREVFTALQGSDNSPLIERLDQCCTGAYFERHKESGKVRIRSNRCFIRWCPLCGKARQDFITNQVEEWISKQKHPKLLTLTVKHKDIPLAEQIAHIYLSFQKLRKRKFFKSGITGMIWFFQIKRSKLDGKWHPHIHALISGSYLPQATIRSEWLEITGDSEIVHIKPIKDAHRSASHTARYATEPCDLSKLDIADSCEVVMALKGKRILGSTGNAKAVQFKAKSDGDIKSWVVVGSYSYVRYLIDSDDRALKIYNAYLYDSPLEPDVTLREIEERVTDEYFEQRKKPPKMQRTFFDDG